MCGIVGIVSNTPQAQRAWLAIRRDSIIHRGPDDAGEWWSADGWVSLAQWRLAILIYRRPGISPCTMRLAPSALFLMARSIIPDLLDELIAKGHGFRSHSATEVMLASYREWGTECLARFNGMFAFALFDARQHTVFLARDYSGPHISDNGLSCYQR